MTAQSACGASCGMLPSTASGMTSAVTSWPSVCLGSERKVRHTTQIQVQTGILAVMIHKERQSQEMTVFCLQGTVFMGGKREIRSRRRVQSEATPSRSPHSKSLKKEALRPRTPI